MRASLAYRKIESSHDDLGATLETTVRAVVGSASRSASSDSTAEHGDSPGRGPTGHSAADLVSAYGATLRTGALDPVSRAFDLAAAASAAFQGGVAPPTVEGEPLDHAIVKSLKLQWNQGVGEARLRLQPEYLGELSVSLRVQGSTVTAVLQADSPTVRSWIESHQSELRRALEDAGLSLDRLVIDADGHPQEQQEQPSRDGRRQFHQRKPEAGRFEALL